MGLLISPLALVTMVKVIHFSFKTKLLCQSVDLLLILCVVFITSFTSCYFNYYYDHTTKSGKTYTYISLFFAYGYLIFPISTYLFAFKYFDSVFSIVWPKKLNLAFKALKYFLWLSLPILNFGLAVSFIVIQGLE